MTLCDLSNPRAHVVCWFGQPGSAHIDIGYDSRDPKIIGAQIAAMRNLGIKGANLLWSGLTGDADHCWSTQAVVNWMRGCEYAKFPFTVMVDHNAQFPVPSLQMLPMFFSSPMYEKWDGKSVNLDSGLPILLTFDDMSPEQLAALPPCALIYRNVTGLAKPQSAGAFEWTAHPSDTQPTQTDKSYTEYFHSKLPTYDLTGKLVINHVTPRFRGASWNTGSRPTPSRNGLEWQESLARVPSDSKLTLVVTWNDWDEGTNVEGTYLQ